METKDVPRPDLFLGLVGAVGTTLSTLIDAISTECSAMGYSVVALRLSDLLQRTAAFKPRGKDPSEDDRINALMDAGNDLRGHARKGDAVTQMAVYELTRIRTQNKQRSGPFVYVFWSLKHPDEVKALRKIYNASCHIISVYAPRHVRHSILCNKILKAKPTIPMKDLSRRVDDLIDRDQSEAGIDHGQNVRDAFYLADFFIDATVDVRNQASRYLRLLFGDPFVTPTSDEYGMFHAKAASLRSADLSRQVGAMILSANGSHLAAGCNEVPMSGGGHYWPDIDPESRDDRDFRYGSDKNAMMKLEMLEEVVAVLKERQWLRPAKAKIGNRALVMDLLSGAKPNLSDTRIANVIEYGRIVHAEMSAISDAATRGVPLRGAKLVSTTFPCHMCTRHIISAGIAEVVYIEPYPKSLAVELYGRSVRVDDEVAEMDDRRVHFRPFIGVSPTRYVELFSFRKRKDGHGFVKEWKATPELRPIVFEPLLIYKQAEYAYSLEGAKLRDETAPSRVSKRTRKLAKGRKSRGDRRQ
jgi:deoxycytidylate deaminase